MTSELAKSYDSKSTEKKWYDFWEKNGLFKAPSKAKGDTFCIVIPPPNITGQLHMGHALNNTIQDVLIRWNRMLGKATLWQPGTDHAGIATQNVVERAVLKTDGKTRHQLGREELIKRIWKWRDEYGNRILEQLRAMGCSCDWSRTRFTLDEGLSKAVREGFVHLYEKGLIYRGKYIVNWCPRCHTALADDEVDHKDEKGNLWHIRYPVKDNPSEYVIVATTRPETMLGDTAVAVNPKDDRYKNLIGTLVHLPETNRDIPIVADDFVDAEFGTGAVKVTPAHDPNDFQIGQRHNLPSIDVMTDDGKMNEDAGKDYAGLTREDCRKKLVEALEKQGLLEKIEDYDHSVGHCYRCKTTVEPRLSDQWFVKMQPLAQRAIKVTEEGKVKFHPERWTKFYLSWLQNSRDWCISRQIWWGHRFPVWYCTDEEKNCPPIVTREDPTKCPTCGNKKLEQESDVLDTWFSSALWPFSTLGWPEKTPELNTYYPTSVLSTDRGIIFFWVARMVMMGLELMDEIPFTNVNIHGTILDDKGRKMSKSLGNGIDPLDMIEKYGTDAMRFSLLVLSVEGQDLKLSESRFDMGKHFCNKLWNACRFALMNAKDTPKKPDDKDLSLADKWIINRFQTATNETTKALEDYRFSNAAQTLYHFVWNEFCDWYVEATKPALLGNLGDKAKNAALHTTLTTLESILRLLHPFMPFITEDIWQNWPVKEKSISIMTTAYPKTGNAEHEDAAQSFARIQKIVDAIRNIRGEHNLPPSKKIKAKIAVSDAVKPAIESADAYIKDLSRLEELTYLAQGSEEDDSAVVPIGEGITVFIPHAGIIDKEEEKARLEKEYTKLTADIERLEKLLGDKGFTAKAPEKVVAKQKESLEESKHKSKEIKQSLENLK